MLVVFGDEVKGLFWRLVYARTKEKFEVAMEELRGINPR
jgi:hypothetical protein